ncbi:MAG: hypothetical protein R3F49_12510 [Planctomycetota bacterium]
MKLFTLTCVATLLTLPGAQQSLRFSPPEGAELRRAWSWELSSKTDSVSTELDGEPSPDVPNLSYTAKRLVEVGVTDKLEVVADGRPARFVRQFDDLVEEFSADLTLDLVGNEVQLSMAGDGTSPIEGLAVRFDWSDERQAWGATWADEDQAGPAALLDGLDADMDLLGLLPAGAVEVGSRWEVELGALARVLFPGGELGIALETDLDQLQGALDPADLPTLADVMKAGELEGEASCTLAALEGELARVEVVVELRAAASFVERIDALAQGAVPGDVSTDVDSAEFAVELTGKGTLTFGLTTGHVQAFEFDGDTVETSEISVTIKQSIEEHAEQRHARSGTLRVRGVIE